jgi:signal peptidase I
VSAAATALRARPASPWLSLALSILAPGLGQLYCGRKVRAALWLGTSLGAFAGWMDWMLSPVRHSWLEGGAWLLAGFAAQFGSWLDAFLLARRGRPRPRRRVRPGGFLRPGRPRPAVALALSALFPGLGHLYLLARPRILLVPLAPLLLLPGVAVMGARVLEEAPAPFWPAWLVSWPPLPGALAMAALSALAILHSWRLAFRLRGRRAVLPRLGRVVLALAAVAWLNGILPWEAWIKARVKAFRIPSASMEPALMIGDRIWARRMASYSRGDIVVFRPPDRPGEDYVKRVAGLPGESVALRNGRLVVGGRRVPEPWAVFALRGGPGRDFGPVRVPPDCVFVLGDNRDNSRDSRYFGPVPLRSVFGRAYKRYWPLGRTGALAPAAPIPATAGPGRP